MMEHATKSGMRRLVHLLKRVPAMLNPLNMIDRAVNACSL